jgi:glycosyltransferase involved in cell wall biosynthesis
MIDVCICTHNPRLDILKIVLEAISRQSIAKSEYQVWIIDNASSPPIKAQELTPLTQAGINYFLLQEPRLGVMYARELAAQAINGEVVLFVDDDNELADNYLEVAKNTLENHPQVGCFSGRLALPSDIETPKWMDQILPYLAIKDYGDEFISCRIEGDYYWQKSEPAAAGAIVRKVVLEQYLEQIKKMPPNLFLSRKGKSGLLSSEDSMIANCAYQLGLECAYQPKLKLTHHIRKDRLKFSYLVLFLLNFGRSHVLLRRAINQPVPVDLYAAFKWKYEGYRDGFISLPYFVCLLAWDMGFIYELIMSNSFTLKTPEPNQD